MRDEDARTEPFDKCEAKNRGWRHLTNGLPKVSDCWCTKGDFLSRN
ncbi:MAG: hypothetical protein ACSW75_03020 [Lachnospiraceae bacterium]